MIDVHVYSFPTELRNANAKLPDAEKNIVQAIYEHPEGPYALSLSSPPAIKESMKRAGITQSVLVSMPWATPELCKLNNDHVLEQTSKENCFFAFCSVQPSQKGWEAEAERVLEQGALGIKINPEWQGVALNSPELDALADFLVKKNALLMTHIDQAYKKSTASPADLYTLAARHPNLKIVAAHMGGLLGLYSTYPPIAQGIQNVWFDTAVSATLPMIKWYVEAGLGHKIILGTDFLFNHSHSQEQVIQGINQLNLDASTFEAIYKNNLFELCGFNIPETSI